MVTPRVEARARGGRHVDARPVRRFDARHSAYGRRRTTGLLHPAAVRAESVRAESVRTGGLVARAAGIRSERLATRACPHPVSYTHLKLPTIYSV